MGTHGSGEGKGSGGGQVRTQVVLGLPPLECEEQMALVGGEGDILYLYDMSISLLRETPRNPGMTTFSTWSAGALRAGRALVPACSSWIPASAPALCLTALTLLQSYP